MSWYLKQHETFILLIKVFPNSAKAALLNGIVGFKGEEYAKCYIHSSPTDGKANQELIAGLAKLIGITKNQMTIISGETSRYKRIKVVTKVPGDFVKIDAIISKL